MGLLADQVDERDISAHGPQRVVQGQLLLAAEVMDLSQRILDVGIKALGRIAQGLALAARVGSLDRPAAAIKRSGGALKLRHGYVQQARAGRISVMSFPSVRHWLGSLSLAWRIHRRSTSLPGGGVLHL